VYAELMCETKQATREKTRQTINKTGWIAIQDKEQDKTIIRQSQDKTIIRQSQDMVWVGGSRI
jgi:hypothetical protein